jgi:hypothetical protein
MKTKEEFLKDVMVYAAKYDRSHGEYPESEYEGLSFYEFVHDELTGEFPDTTEIRKENPDVYRR